MNLFHQTKFRCLTLFFLLLSCIKINAQSEDTMQVVSHFSGAITATQNGISLIPSFSLGKPAVIFNLNVGKKKLTFEPELRFALEGKPWSFLFWWRYQAVQRDQFSLRLGVHPALNFRTLTVISNDVAKNIIDSRRFLATEIAPNYVVSKYFNVGIYYLYSRGFDDSQKDTHFITINASFPKIALSKDYNLGFFPNIYYLKLDERDGFYTSASFRLVKSGMPLSLSAIINKRIKTDIVPNKNLVWNVSLVYAFNKEYLDYKPSI